MVHCLITSFQKILSNKNFKLWFWIGLSALFLGSFVILTSEVQEAAAGRRELIAAIDKFPYLYLEKLRSPRLNEVALNLTALGSVTVVSIFIFSVSFLMFLKKKFSSLLYLIVAGLGSAFFTWAMKSFFERSRPSMISHLVVVQGYSYPSGHSLASSAVYFSFAVLLCNIFPNKLERILIIAISLFFIVLIALSRVYLGVHFVSDVLAGVFIGIGWASVLGAFHSFLQLRRKI